MSARKPLLTTLALLLATALLAPAAPAAAAPAPAPHWSLDSFAIPTDLTTSDNARCASGSLCDGYQVTATDLGAAATDGSAITLTDTLPAALEVEKVLFFWSGYPTGGGERDLQEIDHLCATAASTVTCTMPASLFAEQGATVGPGQTLILQVTGTVDGSSPGPVSNQASIEGGGAPPSALSASNTLESGPPPFGFAAFGSPALGADGEDATEAAAHPYALHTRIDFANSFHEDATGGYLAVAIEDPRDVLVDLPPGLAGSALSTPARCTLAQLSAAGEAAHCPAESQIGQIRSEPSGSASVGKAGGVPSPLYNMEPEHGVVAELGYIDNLNTSHVLYASLVPTPAGYVLRTTSPEIPQAELRAIEVTIFGDPAARDAGRPEEAGDAPTFTSPADCTGEPLTTQIHMDSWQSPGSYNADGSPNLADPAWVSSSSVAEPVSGCEGLHFEPTIEAKPGTNQGDKPTGLEVTLKVPTEEDATTKGTPPLRKAVVTLPEGMTVNPSSANGLEGCSLAGIGVSASGQPDAAAPNCPDASKLGEVELETPALPGVLHGQIYVAKQGENPFNTLLAIYIAIDDPTTGVVVKLPGEVRANAQTGQLETVVDNSPQFPFSELRTKFFGGQKAALRTPAVCGKYTVTSSLTPWSAPQSGPPATPAAHFEITQGCAPSAAQEPNGPSFSAGTLTPTAALYSPFVMKLHREDGSQELKGLNVTLPPGLIGKLAGVGECSEAQLAVARSREHEGGGAEELAAPSCPSSTEVGTVTVGAGAGLTPYYTQGHAYLTGPYKSAPLGLAIITPAVAGPYDLGDVVVRAALRVNPETTQVSAISDPIPTILDGIPLDVRSIALQMARHEFTLNPTNCERKAVTGEAISVLDQTANLSNPFQVGGCKALKFKPKLSLRLKGGTRRNQDPALTAVLTMPQPGAKVRCKPKKTCVPFEPQANIASAQVTLPHSAFLKQEHIKTVCTRPQLASQTCPAGSIYGHATAITPLLDKPVSGPVYLGVGFGHELPDLVAELDGQIRVLLDGKVDTGKEDGLRNTFSVVPDAPVTKFTLEMFGGKKSLIVNSENLCSPHAKVKAVADFTGQNGKVYNTNPTVANSCKGKHKRHRKGHKHHKAHRRPLGRAALGQLLRGW